MDYPKYKRGYKSKITTNSHQYYIDKIFRSTDLIGNPIIHPNLKDWSGLVHNGSYLGLDNNIFNEILDNNNINKDEIHTFINIGAYQQGKLIEKKIYAVTSGNNLTYLNITSQLPCRLMPLSITVINP